MKLLKGAAAGALLSKARSYAQRNPQGVERGLGKAGDTVNRHTGNKHAGTVAKMQQGARKLIGGRSRGGPA